MNLTLAPSTASWRLLAALADAHFSCAYDGTALGSIEGGETLCDLLERTGCPHGLLLADLVHPEDSRRLEDLLDRLLREGQVTGPIRLVSRYGLPEPFILVLLREKDRVLGAVRHNADDALQMRVALETSPDGIAVKDSKLRYRTINGQFCALLGRERADILGKTDAELFGIEAGAAYRQEDRQVLASGRPLVKETRFRRAGRERWMHVLVAPIPDRERPLGSACGHMPDDGRWPARGYIGLAVTLRDISERRRMEEIQRQAQESLRVIFNGVYDAILIHDSGGAVVDVNEKMLEMYGLSREEALAASIVEDLSAPGNPVEKLGELWAQALDGQPRFFEWLARRPKTGEAFAVEVYLRRIPRGGRDVVMANIRDITGRRKAEHERLLASKVFRHSIEGITITDPQANILSVNPAFTKITGYSAKEVIGRNPRMLKSHLHDQAFYAAMWRSLTLDGQWEGEIWNRRKAGEVYPEWLSISSVRDDHDNLQYYVAVFHDITEIKASQEQVRHQAYHDVLTDLPNRLLLKDRISTALAHMARAGQKVALLFLDIDNFKHINDSLGHPVGDQLLQAVAARLKEAVRQEDTVARLGGDEFVVMVEALDNEHLATAAASRLLEAFRAPFHLKGHELTVTPSIGIALYPDDGQDAETLIKNADMAMYRAKEKGRNTFRLYTPALNERAVRRLTMEGDLRKALELGEIRPWLQPRVSLRDGSVLGCEALARWIKADGAIIPPGDFIPLAEETGLIIPLGEQILEQACRQAKALQEAGFPSHYLSVNISPRQFHQKDLADMVARVLARTGFDSRLLELEITESSLVQDVEQAMAMLYLLKDMGLSVAIDDFGTGYSSLAYLKHFPLSALKIDQSFIRGIPRDPSDIAITTTIISMAQSLDLKVIAEGVETPQQLHFLMGLRCDEYQGYHFSRPIPPDEYLKLLERGKA